MAGRVAKVAITNVLRLFKEVGQDAVLAQVTAIIKAAVTRNVAAGVSGQGQADPAVQAALQTFVNKFNATVNGSEHGMGVVLLINATINTTKLDGLKAENVHKMLNVITVADTGARAVMSQYNALNQGNQAKQLAADVVKPMQKVVSQSYHAVYDMLPWGLDTFMKENATPDLAAGIVSVLPGAGRGDVTGAKDLVESFEPWLFHFNAPVGTDAFEKTKKALEDAIK